MAQLKSLFGRTRLERKLRMAAVVVIVLVSYGLYWFLFQRAKYALFRERANAVCAAVVSERNTIPKLVDLIGISSGLLEFMPHTQNGYGLSQTEYYWRILGKSWDGSFSKALGAAGGITPTDTLASGTAAGSPNTPTASRPGVSAPAREKRRIRHTPDHWEKWAAGKVGENAEIVALERLLGILGRLAENENEEVIRGVLSLLSDPVGRSAAANVLREWVTATQGKNFLKALADRLGEEEFLIVYKTDKGKASSITLKNYLSNYLTIVMDERADVSARIAMWRFVMTEQRPRGANWDKIAIKYSALSIDADKIRRNLETTVEHLKVLKDQLQKTMQKGLNINPSHYTYADEVGKFLTQFNQSLDNKTLKSLLAWNFIFPFFMQEYLTASRILAKSELVQGSLIKTMTMLGSSKIPVEEKAVALLKPESILLVRALSEAVKSGLMGKFLNALEEVVGSRELAYSMEKLTEMVNAELDKRVLGSIAHIENVHIGSSFPEVFPDALEMYRYVKPVKLDPTCLRCHERYGHKLGDVLAGVEVLMPWQPEDPGIADLHWKILILIGAAALISLLSSFVIFRRVVVTPMNHLTEVSQRVAEGDLKGLEDVGAHNEFEDFSHTFNQMIDKMKTNQEDLKRLNQDLNRRINELGLANLQLYDQNERKAESLSNIGHEFKTPLNSIIGFAEVIRDSVVGPLNERQKYYLNNIRTSGRHLERMVNQMLEEARAREGKLTVTTSRLEVAGVINRVRVDLGPDVESKVRLMIEIPVNLPPLQTDETKLHQILRNLIDNAIKFSPEEGEVRIIARETDEGIEISISDDGIGIAEKDQTEIFERFRQLDSSTTRKYFGIGIGLSLVKEYLNLLGGEIELESELGKGSTFIVRLPFQGPVSGRSVLDETVADDDSLMV